MLTDVLILLSLILLNGVFAMSEIAIMSSRRARLTQMADAGNRGARHALTLGSEPTRFLSSVQVGITSIGILNGAIGEAAVASRLRMSFDQVPALAPLFRHACPRDHGRRAHVCVSDSWRARTKASRPDSPGTVREHHRSPNASARQDRAPNHRAPECIDGFDTATRWCTASEAAWGSRAMTFE